MTHQASFDFTGPQLRDAGITLATDHAEAVNPGWKERTYELFLQFLSEQSEPFLLEEFRSWLAMRSDYEFPASLRAFGFLTPKASRAGFIQQVGTGRVNNPKAHCANAALWQVVNQ